MNRTDTRRLALRSTPQQRCSTPSLRRSEFLNRQLGALEKEIDQHIDSDPTLKHNDQLLRSIKGVGPRVAQRMNALMSSHRFKSAEALAAYIGLTPCERLVRQFGAWQNALVEKRTRAATPLTVHARHRG